MEKKKSHWAWSVFYYLSLSELPSTCMNSRTFTQQPVFIGDLTWNNKYGYKVAVVSLGGTNSYLNYSSAQP